MSLNQNHGATLNFISPSPCGNLLLLTDSIHNVYMNNRNNDNENYSMDPIYMGGNPHMNSSILSISTP